MVATTTITLTPRESQLRRLLLDVAHYINDSKEVEEAVELRFAGGWVRDRLLGVQSHDIDTAINSMTGYAFSSKLKEYLKTPENLKKHSLEVEDVGNLHKILANPEKSKHLETTTTKLLGFDLDFVNLRKETYCEDSRNPQVEYGTPEEDALRRDATINALFYNLHTDKVEDFVGGLEDLQSGLIKTPLEPHQTFVDDPLRVLRLIRFASRYGFRIDDDCEATMCEPSVLNSLQLKISRERVGVEVEKMLRDNNPRSALHMVDRLGLYSTIFTDPTIQQVTVPDSTRWNAVYDCLDDLKSNETPGSIYQCLVRSEDAKFLSWLLAALVPWAQVGQPENPGGKARLPFATLVAREGIKANNKVCNVVTGAVRNRIEITQLKDAIKNKLPYIDERDTVGMSIRRWDSDGGHWRLQALYALLVEAMGRNNQQGYSTLVAEWQGFIDHLDRIDVMDAPSFKSSIDGNRLEKELGVRPGKWMRPALDVCVAWQLRHPGIKDLSGAIEEVRSRSKELEIPIA